MTNTTSSKKSARQAKNSPKKKCPIVASSLTTQEFKRIMGKLDQDNGSADLRKKLESWQMREMTDDIQLWMLENMIEDSLEFGDPMLDEDSPFPEHQPIQYQIVSNATEMPEEIKQFLRSLEKLVQRTQAQLRRRKA